MSAATNENAGELRFDGLRLFHNPRARRAPAFEDTLQPEGFAAAQAEIESWPGHAPTPLRALAGTAAALGIASLWYKDEAGRFGLGSFKALGGPYAVCRILLDDLAGHTGRKDLRSADLLSGAHRRITQRITVTCATDGNHGRAVAWAAQRFGCGCVVFVPASMSAGRKAAIAGYGAEVVGVAGTYDEAVRRAQEEASRRGWIVVSDTSYEGYVEIPRLVMHGYGVMAQEATAQIAAEAIPTHVFVHAGVGAMAAAVCARFRQRWGAQAPRLVVVEPETADCCYRSAVAGRPAAVPGDLETVMVGLSCGEMSLLAWEVLSTGAEDFIAIADAQALDCVRMLAEGRHGDAPIVAGETGVAGLAGLVAAAREPRARAMLGLDGTSRVLVFGSEGATDPEIYRRIVGEAE